MTGLSWQEFLDLPDDYHRASLIDGELYVTAAARIRDRDRVGRRRRADVAGASRIRGALSDLTAW
jgi:hypothetical protein